MHSMHISAIDANLFVVLHALLEEQNVARAAKRVGLSPSATSHALARLREVLGDPLFVRAGRRLAPTTRARELATPVAQAVAALEAAIAAPREIDAKLLKRTFRVETTDHLQFVLMRRLDPILRAEAPGVDVYLQALHPATYARLREGSADLAIGLYPEREADIEGEDLFDDRLVAVVRRGHPALRGRATLARFAELEHLLVAPTGTPTGLVDRLLAEHGLKRRVARTSSTFLDMAFLVAETDYVVSLPRKMLEPLLDHLGLAIFAVPMLLPAFTVTMVWHKRHATDGAHAWFRAAVRRACAVGAPPRRRGARRAG
jgi:DNA-binding transcriptional LysR family regulator